ncbi:hypothetical protein [Acinetobacter baumannii]|uniref:hypothetical protein n=1 Tax=Acinetobacter baumannii TaxID=470 RepID=UPI001BC87A24|nr:hypothetical protein [Acinetobacter baumannii]
MKKAMMASQDISDFKKLISKRNSEAPFKYWLENVLTRKDKLPRGKFFKGKIGGKPIIVLDEFWTHSGMYYAPPGRGMSAYTWDRPAIVNEANKLNGRLYKDLNAYERSLFEILLSQGRKYGIEIKIASEVSVSEILNLPNFSEQQMEKYLVDKQAPIQIVIKEGEYPKSAELEIVASGTTGLGRHYESND